MNKASISIEIDFVNFGGDVDRHGLPFGHFQIA